MKNIVAKSCAAGLAICALVQPQMALAQECVDQDDFSAATIYAMPLLADAVTSKCGDELSPNGFFATKGEEFVAPYRATQDANWPATLRVLKVFGSRGSGPDGMSDMMDALPESALRPFVDAIIESMVAKEIKFKDCSKFERGVSLLAPLPPENVGDLVSFLMDMADVKNPEICPYKGDETE